LRAARAAFDEEDVQSHPQSPSPWGVAVSDTTGQFEIHGLSAEDRYVVDVLSDGWVLTGEFADSPLRPADAAVAVIVVERVRLYRIVLRNAMTDAPVADHLPTISVLPTAGVRAGIHLGIGPDSSGRLVNCLLSELDY
jgi:hypothetical protein